MRGSKGIISILLVFVILFGFLPAGVFAASPVEVSVVSYLGGNLTISWANINLANEIRISYKQPNGQDVEVLLGSGTTSYELKGLQDNFIYEINLEGRDNGGAVIAKGLLYFLPGITFESSFVPETVIDTDDGATSVPPYDSKGGREIGTKPRLNVKWTVPQIFNGSQLVYANEALDYIESRINAVYGTSRNINGLNYKINISQDKGEMSGNAAVLINEGSNGYKAAVSGSTLSANVRFESSTGRMDFDLIGRKDRYTDLPDAEQYGLPHPDILPGTVYFMNIQMVIDGYQDAVVMGADGTSSLKGKLYTYTPIRFQLSKDDAGNIYVKVYTLNQGSLTLPDLYYEVQSNTVDSTYGWTTKAKIDPDYFKDSYGRNQEFGIIPIIGASTQNKVYYRVITSSTSDDVIKSQTLPYVMALDKTKPPIPKDVNIIDRNLVTGTISDEKGKREGISTDVTISWDRPLNWDEIKNSSASDDELYYCFVLNISQSDILERPYPPLIDNTNNIKYEDYFPAKYRLVKYVSAKTANLPDNIEDKIRENGNRLEYTLKGFDLFSWTDSNGVKHDFSADLRSRLGIESNYPAFLLSNKVYYLQVFTVKGNPETDSDVFNNSSDRSVTVSFTTLPGTQKKVPLPNNFGLARYDGNTYVIEEEVVDGVTRKITSNIIKLQFDEITGLKWSDYTTKRYNNKIYYDLYMSTSPDKGYVLIGSTDSANDEFVSKNNVKFEVITEGQYRYVEATIKDFEKDPAVTSFGRKLTPNTTYYFKLKTRLVMARKAADPNDPSSLVYPDDYDVKESEFSQILPVTTVRGEITEPGPDEKMPLAPVDFHIAVDKNGNQLLTGSSVVFEWERKEKDVKYILIATSERLPMNADSSMYTNDPVYQDFKKYFNITGKKIGIELDPGLNENQYPKNFEYDSSTNTCRYKIDEWLFPNRLYYFSLIAVNKKNENVSPWICIPVTTKLVEAPSGLEAIHRGEIGFYWMDSSINARPEDFDIYIKGPKDKDYKLVGRSQCTIVRDSNTIVNNGTKNYVYYGRIYNLELNTQYSIRVYKRGEQSKLVYSRTGVYTRDGYSELQVKWRGRKGYTYEIAIKAADEVDYVTLTPDDLEMYTDVEGNKYPYYIEETIQTYDNDDVYYYAKIKSMLVTLPDGSKERRPLESNKKYHIKVRTVRIDAVDSTLVAYSKYIGPVQSRTEFNQDDYDKGKDEEDRRNKFLDKVKELENRYYWRVNISNSSANTILLRDQKIINALNSTRANTFTVDVSEIVQNIETDVIYVPINIIKTLNKDRKSLVIKTKEFEFTIRPDTFDVDDNEKIKLLSGRAGVKDILLKLTVKRDDKGRKSFPAGTKLASSVIDFAVEAQGINQTTEALEQKIHDKLYDEEDGLLSEKLNILINTYAGDSQNKKQALNQYVTELVKLVELELSNFIHTNIETMKLTGMSSDIQVFDTPLMVRLHYTGSRGLKLPYVLYKGKNTWQKVTADSAGNSGTLLFNVTGAGQYVVLIAGSAVGDIPDSHWAKKDIEKFTSKYDLSTVFTGIESAFAPEDIVTRKEMVLLYEVVTNKGSSTGDIRQKLETTGLDSIFNTRNVAGNVTKQEAAAVLVKVYSAKAGINVQNLKLNRTLHIADEDAIDDRFLKSVMIVVDKGFMELDENRKFHPGGSLNRAQVISIFVKLLENTGDL
ncbi:MAG TPA: hypothetical protein GXX36_15110 [Clostridiaceae bacterium]|nr:hypothetical protein [Clostridiaceae bacterium]